jgi:hypothetical protein
VHTLLQGAEDEGRCCYAIHLGLGHYPVIYLIGDCGGNLVGSPFDGFLPSASCPAASPLFLLFFIFLHNPNDVVNVVAKLTKIPRLRFADRDFYDKLINYSCLQSKSCTFLCA